MISIAISKLTNSVRVAIEAFAVKCLSEQSKISQCFEISNWFRVFFGSHLNMLLDINVALLTLNIRLT